MYDIKPCPFCGSEKLDIGLCMGNHYVFCKNCCADGPDNKSVAKAIDFWNAAKRADD